MILSDSIATLRARLSTDKNLSTFWNYFLDLAMEPEFIAAGEPCSSPELESTLELVGRQVYGKPKVRIEDGRWLALREYDLVHGVCTIERRLASAVYFPGLKMGVSGFQKSGANLVFSRFSPPDLGRMEGRGGVQ